MRGSAHTFLLHTDAFDPLSGNFTADSFENFKGKSVPSKWHVQPPVHGGEAGVAARFTGRFLDADRIDLQSPERRITLLRVRQ